MLILVYLIALYYIIGLICAIKWSKEWTLNHKPWNDKLVNKWICILIMAWIWVFLIDIPED